ncbi:TniB family NTP-binding protein [Endozoicomonas numazuensis]|uniref:AAA+ ATPase domain-containing protein n=1 Tax=Endozoicomonas numazuensis TaxID=1137799 RepID=A0A081NLT1_9GAMM|nr:TniB family NTP-binding protein [Endozoicomonas numazuensis]KEQ19404.1 hypothetical protein GZ78_05475 [Endozoicomonas numazuensis]
MSKKTVIEQDKEYILDLFITYPPIDEIISYIEKCLLDSKDRNQPLCLLITGDTGSGKSEIGKQCAKLFPRNDEGIISKVPFLYSQVFGSSKPKDLSSKLLHDLGDPAYNRGTDKDLRQRAIDMLSDENIGNKGVYLDEFHSLIDTDNQSVIFSTGEALKDIIIGSKSTFIAAGMPWSTVIIETNRQLARRFKKIINIPFIDIRNKDEYDIFTDILKNCDEYLPFKKNFLSANHDIIIKMFACCAGRTGDLFDIIKWAAIEAFSNNQKSITLENLASAFDVEGDSFLISDNPFTTSNNNNLKIKILTEQSKWLKEEERIRGEKRIRDAIFENFSAAEILSPSKKTRKKK